MGSAPGVGATWAAINAGGRRGRRGRWHGTRRRGGAVVAAAVTAWASAPTAGGRDGVRLFFAADRPAPAAAIGACSALSSLLVAAPDAEEEATGEDRAPTTVEDGVLWFDFRTGYSMMSLISERRSAGDAPSGRAAMTGAASAGRAPSARRSYRFRAGGRLGHRRMNSAEGPWRATAELEAARARRSARGWRSPRSDDGTHAVQRLEIGRRRATGRPRTAHQSSSQDGRRTKPP